MFFCKENNSFFFDLHTLAVIILQQHEVKLLSDLAVANALLLRFFFLFFFWSKAKNYRRAGALHNSSVYAQHT